MDENQDKSTQNEKNNDIFNKIHQYKEQKELSWSKLAQKIYLEHTKDSDEHLTSKEEEDLIKKFTQNLRKAISRRTTKIKMGEDKIFLKDIFSILDIDYKKNLPIPKTLPAKEKYIEMNIQILYHREILWEEFIEKALQEVTEAANNGFKEAQTLLAHFYYYYGNNGISNVSKALEYYQQAAEQNDEIALYQLGLLYEYGNEKISPDWNKAYKYYEQSAKAMFPLAFNKLAFCYYRGFGTPKNIQKFLEYAKKSKEYDDVVGTLYLAFAYKEGIGVEIDKKLAIDIYETLLGNDKVQPYLIEILWSLAKLCKEKNIPNKAKEYFDRSLYEWQKMMHELWNCERFDTIAQFFTHSPEKYNEILKHSHYDYVNQPSNPTIVKALLNI